MATTTISASGEFGFIPVDDVINAQDTWLEMSKVSAGLIATVELRCSTINTAGGQRIYVGILPNGGTDPTNLSTLGDLRVIEWYTKLVPGTPFINNAIVLGGESELWVYCDNVDAHFYAHGMTYTA